MKYGRETWIDVAAELSPYHINTLRTRNIRRELDNFTELCTYIGHKSQLCDRDLCPKWVLVVVAKADLYWNERIDALNYYRARSGSPFDSVFQSLQIRFFSGNQRMHYKVVPTAFRPRDFRLVSDFGMLEAPSLLQRDNCERSIVELVDVLEEISGG